MVSITVEQWEQRHSLILDNTTFPTTQQVHEWIEWAEGKIIAYLQVSELPDDNTGIIKNVVDDLLYRKYTLEKLFKLNNPRSLINVSQPQLTPDNMFELDLLKGSDPSIESSSFNFDLTKTSGGFEY